LYIRGLRVVDEFKYNEKFVMMLFSWFVLLVCDDVEGSA
jgi:hypothetical protein